MMYSSDTFYEKEKETMSVAERETYLNERLRDIVRYAYEKAPSVKGRLDKENINPSDISTIRDLERIPVMPKVGLAAMQKANPPFGGLLTVPRDNLRRIYCSPGPIFHADVSKEYSVGFAKGFHAGGFRKGDTAIISTSYHMVPAGLWADEGLGLLGVTSMPAGTGNTELVIEIARQAQCTGYVGFPSFLMSLIKTAERLGYDWHKDFAIKLAAVGGEPFPEAMWRSFREDYGINAAQFYANAENGMLAYECPQKSGFHVVDDILIEIVEPETGRQLGPGEIGEVVVTDFVESYPIIRLGTGDLSMFSEDAVCSCGRTSPRLTGILGRIGANVLRVKGLFLYLHEVQQVMAQFPQISDFEISVRRVDHRDEILARLELAEGEADGDQLADRFKTRFTSGCWLKLNEVKFVDRGSFAEGHLKMVDERHWT